MAQFKIEPLPQRQLVVIDTATDTITASLPLAIPVTETAGGLAITKDGKSAYVTTGGSTAANGEVRLIDLATGTINTTINVGTLPGFPALTPDGAYLYFSSDSYSTTPSYVGVIKTSTNKVVAKVKSGVYPAGYPVGTTFATGPSQKKKHHDD
jgi:YVTN family beta-propeller protein